MQLNSFDTFYDNYLTHSFTYNSCLLLYCTLFATDSVFSSQWHVVHWTGSTIMAKLIIIN